MTAKVILRLSRELFLAPAVRDERDDALYLDGGLGVSVESVRHRAGQYWRRLSQMCERLRRQESGRPILELHEEE